MDLLCRVHTQRRTPLTSPRSESYVTVGGRSGQEREKRQQPNERKRDWTGGECEGERAGGTQEVYLKVPRKVSGGHKCLRTMEKECPLLHNSRTNNGQRITYYRGKGLLHRTDVCWKHEMRHQGETAAM